LIKCIEYELGGVGRRVDPKKTQKEAVDKGCLTRPLNVIKWRKLIETLNNTSKIGSGVSECFSDPKSPRLSRIKGC